MKPFAAALLTFSLTIAAGGLASAQPRACDSWRALYAAVEDDGSRVLVEFVRGEGSGPLPLHITGFGADGKRSWRHTGRYWCYQGSGGCYVALGYKDKERTEDESENGLRIVFANADPKVKNPERAADILVIAGINSAFFYGQNDGGLVIQHEGGEGDPVFVPEVYYFDRCQAN